ncbi:MAG: GTP-binding protein [Planctomycetes bacterium]|nr:GTP-binding protein [Planctomycetota bacterium]
MKSKTLNPTFNAWFGALLAVVGLALLGWVLSSINELYDRLAVVSEALAGIVLILLLATLFGVLWFGLRFLWIAIRSERRSKPDAKIASDPGQAAGQSVEAARKQIELVVDEVARRALSDEVESIADDLSDTRYTIVVFGTGSAGKTSIINALLGRDTGITDPAVGTTQAGAEHTYTIDGFSDGRLRLVDTPGLSEIGEGGVIREEQARELATGADLLLFVVDQDLRDIEFQPLASLARLGKRSLLVLNKRDLYPPEDVAAIKTRLCERVEGLVKPDDVLVCAADPAPVAVRDASGENEDRTHKPDRRMGELADRIAAILREDGKTLLAANILLRAKQVSQKARDSIHQARAQRALAIVTRFQWTTAAVMFVNPVPGLGALAAAAVNFQMITEIARTFSAPVTVDAAKRMAGELGQIMLKMGVVTVTTNLLGKALKASVVGFVAGGAIEAVAGAYLTRLSGQAFIDYFAQDQDWGEGGMQGAIERRFNLEGQSEFITRFVKEAARRVFKSDTRGDDRSDAQNAP